MAQVLERRPVAMWHDDGDQALAPLLVLDAGDDHVPDPRVLGKHCGDLGGNDVLAAGDDDVIEAPVHHQPPVRRDSTDVTGGEPAVGQRLLGEVGRQPVTAHEHRAGEQDTPGVTNAYGDALQWRAVVDASSAG